MKGVSVQAGCRVEQEGPGVGCVQTEEGGGGVVHVMASQAWG